MGLADAYQILQWHRGSVGFESLEGQGTTFRFRIPAAPGSAETGQESSAHSVPELSKPVG